MFQNEALRQIASAGGPNARRATNQLRWSVPEAIQSESIDEAEQHSTTRFAGARPRRRKTAEGHFETGSKEA